MPPKPPRFLPTLGLAVVWVAVYFLWVAVRPTADPAPTTRPSKGATTTTTTVEPLFRFKP